MRHTYAQSGNFLVRAWARDQDGGTSVLAQQLVLARRIGGDADGDERVDLSDFGVLKQHFGQANRDVRQGDFNGDSHVDLTDFGILKENFGRNKAQYEDLPVRSKNWQSEEDLRWAAALHIAFAKFAVEG